MKSPVCHELRKKSRAKAMFLGRLLLDEQQVLSAHPSGWSCRESGPQLDDDVLVGGEQGGPVTNVCSASRQLEGSSVPYPPAAPARPTHRVDCNQDRVAAARVHVYEDLDYAPVGALVSTVDLVLLQYDGHEPRQGAAKLMHWIAKYDCPR